MVIKLVRGTPLQPGPITTSPNQPVQLSLAVLIKLFFHSIFFIC